MEANRTGKHAVTIIILFITNCNDLAAVRQQCLFCNLLPLDLYGLYQPAGYNCLAGNQLAINRRDDRHIKVLYA